MSNKSKEKKIEVFFEKRDIVTHTLPLPLRYTSLRVKERKGVSQK